MTRKTLTFALLALMAITAHAQHFDWAKGYGSSQEGCLIKGTVTDSDGNLYILGQFTKDATWDGHRILPITPYGPGQNTTNTLIAKISPSGGMLWEKVIHSNNSSNNLPYDIKKVSDTAFAVLVEMTLPTSDQYTYFLDTLLPSWSDYPSAAWGMENPRCTAFIMFDFDGNVKEQHILQLSYTDTVGNDIVEYYDSEPWFKGSRLYNPSFDIDNDGNIYMCREAQDYLNPNLNTQVGTLKGVKIWCDRRVVGEFDIPDETQYWFPQLLKFSPHFDTLLANRYIVQKSDSLYYETINSDTKIDAAGNVYCLRNQNMQGYSSNTIVIDSAQGISFSLSEKNKNISYLVQLSANLDVNWKITLDDSMTFNSNTPSMTLFHDIAFDTDSNLLFLSATSHRGYVMDTINFCSVLKYLDYPLSLKNDAFVISFSLDGALPSLHSYGRVPSIYNSEAATNARGNLVCLNNRVFMQSAYMGGVHFPSQDIHFNQQNAYGLGLSVFDYSGNLIMGIDYSALSPTNDPGSISLHDSILYLSGILTSDATFGDIHLPEQGRFAYMAKYIDTAFMTPYVHTEEPGEVSITLVEDGTELVAYPNPFRQSVRIKVQGGQLKEHNGTGTAILTDLSGRREEVRLTPDAPGQYTLDLTSRPQATYLLTLTTADGKQHTVRLLKQSDMFGN